MTRAQWDDRTLAYLREHDGYFNVFWATENQFRAHSLDRLIRAGIIKEDHLERGIGYPLCHAVIAGAEA